MRPLSPQTNSLPTNLLLFLLVTPVLVYFTSSSLVNENYSNIGLIVIPIFIFISSKNALILLMSIGFFGDQLIQFGAPPNFIYLWDLTLIILFFKTILQVCISSTPLNGKAVLPVLGIVIVITASYYLNGTSVIQTLLFTRYMVTGYLLLFTILNLRLSETDIASLLRYIVFLFLIQIPASIVKLFLLGQGEHSVGTFGFSPGTDGTLIPLFAISFLVAFILHNPVKRYLYLVLILCFIGVSLIAEKRAFIFILPIICMLSMLVYKKNILHKIRQALPLLIVLPVLAYALVRLHPTLNPEHRTWGDFDFHYLYAYVDKYTNLHDEQGRSQGRFATTQMTMRTLSNYGLGRFLVGDGPGKIINSGIIDASLSRSILNYDIEDGSTGFMWLGIQIGVLGFSLYMLFLFTLFYSIWKLYRQTDEVILRIIGLGLLGVGFVILFDVLIYSKNFMTGGRRFGMMFFILAGIYLRYAKNGVKMSGINPG